MIWQFISIITYVLYITYTYWTLVDARVKKDEHFENKKNVTWTPNNIFDFLNLHPFSFGGFFTVLVDLALCAPPCRRNVTGLRRSLQPLALPGL